MKCALGSTPYHSSNRNRNQRKTVCSALSRCIDRATIPNTDRTWSATVTAVSQAQGKCVFDCGRTVYRWSSGDFVHEFLPMHGTPRPPTTCASPSSVISGRNREDLFLRVPRISIRIDVHKIVRGTADRKGGWSTATSKGHTPAGIPVSRRDHVSNVRQWEVSTTIDDMIDAYLNALLYM
jgi:hypothetical protein